MSQSKSGIYAIKRDGVGICYIGQTRNVSARKCEHLCALRAGKHTNKRLQNAWNKDRGIGFEFVVLQTDFDPLDVDALALAEQLWIDRERPAYNSRAVANSNRGLCPSEETRNKRRGKKASAETRERMRVSHIGIRHTAEAKAKIGAKHKGKVITPEMRAKISQAKKGCAGPMAGIARIESVKCKISAAKTGVPWSQARRAAEIARQAGAPS